MTQAISHYRQALDTIEGLRAGLGSKESKSTYMKNKLFVYDELIELLRSLHEKDPAKGYDREALEIFERKQGRLFLEEMGQSGARNFAGLPEQVKSQETELENRLDKLTGRPGQGAVATPAGPGAPPNPGNRVAAGPGGLPDLKSRNPNQAPRLLCPQISSTRQAG